jgi:translation initiation factor 4B
VGNLSFDLTESEVENYFEGCKVISVRIMKDRMDNRPKGFGYVEFADLDSLKKALSLADGQLAGRGVRVSVAEPRTLLLKWRITDICSKIWRIWCR